MQSHPTNNTKLYRSSQLLHQHSERSRQQHDFSSMANAWQRIPSHPIPSPSSAGTPGSRWGRRRGSCPPSPLPEHNRNSGGFCGGRKKEGSPRPGRPLGPRGQRGAPDHSWPSAEWGQPLAPSAPSQALPPASVILGSSGCCEGGMSPLLTPWEICKTLQLPKGGCGFFFFFFFLFSKGLKK